MQDWPLLCHRIIDHAAQVHGKREVVTRSVEGPVYRTNYAEIRARALKVAQRLDREGVKFGDRVAIITPGVISSPGMVSWNTAAAMCYTSGTTGDPKGVVYSHRSNVLHSMMANNGDALGAKSKDTMLPVVPLFHANSWGIAFSRAGVSTVWLMLLQHMEKNNLKLPDLKVVVCGGSAMPRSMLKAFDDMGVEVRHAWGMTEMSPLGTVGALQGQFTHLKGDAKLDVRQMQGYAPFMVEMKITVDAGKVLPWNGKTFGRLKVRGPAVSGAYFRVKDNILDEQAFFDTGDVATIDEHGYMRITDRSKDVITSGGEWISSIDLENLAVGHPKVAEAAVGVHHPKWNERPLLIAQGRPERDPRGHPHLHGRQDRQVVDARRRRIRRQHSAYRHGKDPEDGATRSTQELQLPECSGVSSRSLTITDSFRGSWEEGSLASALRNAGATVRHPA